MAPQVQCIGLGLYAIEGDSEGDEAIIAHTDH